MSFRDLRILPLMIFVAFVAFSVRLADVAVGFSSSGGLAAASETAPAHEAGGEASADKKESAGTATIPVPPPVPGPMDADPKGALQFPEAKTSADGKPIGWQDASDIDVDYSAVRKDLEEDLAKRRADLDEREKQLQTKEALLKAGEQELDRKYSELSQLKQEIEKLLETQSAEEKARIASLVKIYEGMKPDDAARIFNTLDLDILVSVLSEMSERKLAPVLAAMDSERAKTVTVMLAEQKQLPSLPPSQ